MDYKERYEKALAIARKLYNEAKAIGFTSDMVDYELIFPELKESDDERIRKELINFFKHYPNIIVKKERRNDWIAWLEKQRYSEFELENEYWRGYDDDAKKQGEQKPAWSEEDEEMFKRFVDLIPQYMTAHGYNELFNWFKSLKDRVQPQPKQEWSEEEEKMLIKL